MCLVGGPLEPPPPRGGPKAEMDHLCTIRSRPPPFANIQKSSPICRNRPSVFATVRVGRLCKQGVVGSSPIVSTALIREDTQPGCTHSFADGAFMAHCRPRESRFVGPLPGIGRLLTNSPCSDR